MNLDIQKNGKPCIYMIQNNIKEYVYAIPVKESSKIKLFEGASHKWMALKKIKTLDLACNSNFFVPMIKKYMKKNNYPL